MEIINKIFKLCVVFLQKIADLTGTTYEFVNVVIFCILIPVAFIFLFLLFRGAKREARKYKELYHKFLAQDMDNI
jgi:hypothetical protein